MTDINDKDNEFSVVHVIDNSVIADTYAKGATAPLHLDRATWSGILGQVSNRPFHSAHFLRM